MSIGAIAQSRLLGLSGGGGSTTKTASLNFRDADYMLDGSTVTVDDILEQDIVYGSWDPDTDISAGVGYVSGAPAMKSAAYDIVSPAQAGFVAVVTMVVPSVASQWQMDWIELPSFVQDASAQIGKDYVYLQTWDGDFGGFSDDTGLLAAGTRKLAIKFTPSNILVRTQEGVEVATAASTNSSPAYTTIVMNQYDDGTPLVVELVDFYPVDADLATVIAL